MKSVVGILGLFLSIQAVYGATDFLSLQERAQGQALTGTSVLNDSLYSNPAGSAFTQVYTVEGIYALPRSFAASVLDTRSSSVGGGLSYYRVKDVAGAEPFQGAKLALMGRVNDWLGVGVAGKMLWGLNNQGNKTNLKDVDAGLLARFMPFHVGVSFKNVFGGDPSLGQVPEWAAGASVTYQQILILSVATLGEMSPVKPYQYGFGVEYITPYYVSLKGGFRTAPSRNESYWTTGISFLAPRLSVHYSVQLPQAEGQRPEHYLGTTILF